MQWCHYILGLVAMPLLSLECNNSHVSGMGQRRWQCGRSDLVGEDVVVKVARRQSVMEGEREGERENGLFGLVGGGTIWLWCWRDSSCAGGGRNCNVLNLSTA